MRTIYLDGQYFDVNDQLLDVFTPGDFKAKGVFETMLGMGGFVIDADLHMKRMEQGLKVLGVKAPPIQAAAVLKKVLQRNQLTTARVRMMVWQVAKQVHVMAAALPYKAPDQNSYRVCLIKTSRQADDSMANVKSLDYGMFADAFSRARKQGFDEALLLNRRGHIFEASRANIFWMKDNVLYTPPLSSGCLNGITRQQVIKQAKHLKIPVKEEELTPAMLKKADAAFLTNSLAGVKAIDID